MLISAESTHAASLGDSGKGSKKKTAALCRKSPQLIDSQPAAKSSELRDWGGERRPDIEREAVGEEQSLHWLLQSTFLPKDVFF